MLYCGGGNNLEWMLRWIGFLKEDTVWLLRAQNRPLFLSGNQHFMGMLG